MQNLELINQFARFFTKMTTVPPPQGCLTPSLFSLYQERLIPFIEWWSFAMTLLDALKPTPFTIQTPTGEVLRNRAPQISLHSFICLFRRLSFGAT